MKQPRFMIAIALCLCLAAGARAQTTESEGSSEYLVKAGFIYNFTKLVDWPASAFAQSDSPIVIGILGTDPFGSVLDSLVDNKKINGRALVVKRLKSGTNPKDCSCNLLFVSSSETAHLDDVLRAVKGMPILTVGETPGFASRGGVIGLIIDDDKVRFEVKVDAAKQAGLNMSSRLLALAKIVP